jgi:glyoxylase-like metal-dependent hydrolase (beta-lactamase superfamily II)
LADVELVLLTHQHIDHVGLAEIVMRRAGADVACHVALAAWLEHLPMSHVADDAHIAARLRGHGVPIAEIAAFDARATTIRSFGSQPTPTVTLRDGEELCLRDRTLRAEHRPGHSPTDTVLVDTANGLMFTGDHLMTDAWTTPYLAPGAAAADDWAADFAPARALRAALEQTARTVPGVLGLPGHGEPVHDVRVHAAAVLKRQQARAESLLERIDRPTTAAELRSGRFTRLSPARGYLGLFEVLAELALLQEQGLVACLPGSPARVTRSDADRRSRRLGRDER